MLGQFWFRDEPPDEDVVLDLCWIAEEPRGRVVTPVWVSKSIEGSELKVAESDQYISLPLALSYGLLVASSVNLKFTVSGDASVWPEEWGNLLEGELRQFRVPAPRSRST